MLKMKQIDGGATTNTKCDQRTCAYTCQVGCIPNTASLGACDVETM